MARIVDLSHPIRHGMITYPGLPGPTISDHLSREASHAHYAAGYEFQIGRVELVANTGTYLDTPFHRGTDHYGDPSHPFVSVAAAERLDAGGAAVVGIDSVNIDDTRTGERPIHTALLGAGIPIVEHLCRLDEIGDAPFRFTALPPAFEGVGTFPVRAIATIDR